MERNRAESLDAAREKWWIGLRDTEETRYDAAEGDPEKHLFRIGFEAALEPGLRGKSFHDAQTRCNNGFRAFIKKSPFNAAMRAPRSIIPACRNSLPRRPNHRHKRNSV